jgi:hydrogenase maturation protease
MIGTLVIGYGSTLHRDDAAGPLIAERVAAWDKQDVRALAVLQLTPELVDSLSQVGRVIFVDATAEECERGVAVRRLLPNGGTSLGHVSDPGWLLGLCQALYGRCPEAWLVTVPAAALDLGEGLSSVVAAQVDAALRLIQRLARPG